MTSPLPLSRRRALTLGGAGLLGLGATAALAGCTSGTPDAAAVTTAPTTSATTTSSASSAASTSMSASSSTAATTATTTPAPLAPVGMTELAFTDPEFDGQFLRALDTIFDGGADVSECFVTARRIVPGDTDSWYEQWTATADRIMAIGDKSAAAGHDVSAHQAYLRAVTYYRTAGTFMYAPPMDPRFVQSYESQRAAFQKAAALGRWTTEIVQIPYENTTLEGYFILPDGDGPFRTLVMVDGYDGTKEEMFFSGGTAALERGYAVLLVDGPGQGGALIEQKLYFRPDWEKVVTPQIDWLVQRPEVDVEKIALIGRSWGGYLAPRAATAEHRIAALIADAAQYTPGPRGAFMMPEQYRDELYTGDPAVLNAALEAEMAQSSEIRFTLLRGMLTHGFDTPLDYLRGAVDYTIKGLADRITCPTLICEAENDVRGGDAKPLYEALTAPKTYVLFTNAEGAGEHDEAGAASLFGQVVFDWLDETLAG
ncbi:alpha/beta fold hydrolase [Nakamurella sp. YIM 132087]|uniref:Alpha/beta fold hydrolase n=1 Tax=Nakamurella alba TaxID=2665158 RepID=A0A7K1FLX9_9ACTN|nr:alpha/beta fold hydrolase [Nakamurella alba]MTD15116.1 alpha/beta fold hydrolase [Nakamurella alba]